MNNRTYEELKSKNIELEAILQTNPDLIFILDMESNFLEVYTNTPELLFMSIEEFIGKNLSIIIPPDKYDIIKIKIEEAKKSSKLQVAKYDLMIFDRKSYFEARILSFDSDKLICIIRDITDEENLRIELERRNKLINSITNATPFFIYVYDFEKNDIIFKNKEITDVFNVGNKLMDLKSLYQKIFLEEDLIRFGKFRENFLLNNNDEVDSIEVRLKVENDYYEWYRITNKIFERSDDNKATKILGIIENIENQKENESKIIESNLFINNVLSISPVFIGIFDNNSLKLSYINKRIEDRLSFNLQEINEFEKSFFSLINEDDKEKVSKHIDDYIKGKVDKYEIEFRLKNKNNVYQWVLSRGNILKNEKNIPVRFVGSHTDINDKKLEQIKNEELEKRWQFALEGSGDGVWDWDMVENTVFFSKQWKSMLGYDVDDFGNDLSEWDKRVHPDDKEEVYNKLNEYLEAKTEIFISQHRSLCKDGSYKWILDRGKVVERDIDGKPIRVIGTHTDINELLLTQEKLINSEKRFKNIIDAAGEYIWEADENSRYTFVSDRFYKLLGYTHEEVIGKSPYDFMAEEDKRKLQRQFFAVRRTKSKFKDISFKIKRKDGELVWHSINGRPILDSDNEISGYIGVGSDITDSIEKENEIRYRESIFNSFVKLAPLGIALTDLNTGNFIEVNDKLIEPTGYTKEEFLNLSYWDLTPKKYEEQEAKQLKSLNEKGFYGPYQKEYIK